MTLLKAPNSFPRILLLNYVYYLNTVLLPDLGGSQSFTQKKYNCLIKTVIIRKRRVEIVNFFIIRPQNEAKVKDFFTYFCALCHEDVRQDQREPLVEINNNLKVKRVISKKTPASIPIVQLE